MEESVGKSGCPDVAIDAGSNSTKFFMLLDLTSKELEMQKESKSR